MFKSLNTQTSKEIVILDPYWNDSTLFQLRAMSRENHLVCPVCKEDVHVRAGEKNRWHFAHKSLSDCPLKHESPNLLQARSFLYSWLKSKYPDKVTIEKHFPESGLPRPLDCYVDVSENKKFGYWILEKGIRSRYQVQHSLFNLNFEIKWLFLSNMLRIDEERLTSVRLTPTERDFTYPSEYNAIYSQYDQSLNYFDIDDCSVVTLRGLRCIHEPQEYKFSAKLIDKLQNILISPVSGEFVYKEEHEKLREYFVNIELERQRHEEEKRQQIKRQKLLNEQIREESFKSKSPPVADMPRFQRINNDEKSRSSIGSDFDRAYPCSICGAITSNWTSLDLSKNTCICSRECLQKQQGRN